MPWFQPVRLASTTIQFWKLARPAPQGAQAVSQNLSAQHVVCQECPLTLFLGPVCAPIRNTILKKMGIQGVANVCPSARRVTTSTCVWLTKLALIVFKEWTWSLNNASSNVQQDTLTQLVKLARLVKIQIVRFAISWPLDRSAVAYVKTVSS